MAETVINKPTNSLQLPYAWMPLIRIFYGFGATIMCPPLLSSVARNTFWVRLSSNLFKNKRDPQQKKQYVGKGLLRRSRYVNLLGPTKKNIN